MSHLGLKVLIDRVFGGDQGTGDVLTSSLHKEIAALELRGNALRFTFSDGSNIELFDDGQSCCESRYIQTDDDLAYYVGAQLLDVDIKEAPNEPDICGVHEVQFLEVSTSKGSFTVANHNEHNGYYGGFSIRAAVVNGSEGG